MSTPLAGLAFLGRHGTRAFALSLLLGFALPGVATFVKPLFGPIIFAFVAINVMRADLPTIRRVVADPLYVAVAVAANTLIPFILVGAVVAAIGRDAIDPGLLLGLSLAVAAPPLVAAPAYALLLGFSNAMPLTILVLGMAISPLTAPILADTLAGEAVPIDRWQLTLRLAVFLGVAGAVGLAARRWVGEAFLVRRKAELDGAGVVLFFVFAIALTDSVRDGLLATPGKVAIYFAITSGTCAASYVATWLLWRRFGAEDAMTLALATSLRNMGMLVAVTGLQSIPENTFLFFALTQFPIYFAPQILKPFADRIGRVAALPPAAPDDTRRRGGS